MLENSRQPVRNMFQASFLSMKDAFVDELHVKNAAETHVALHSAGVFKASNPQ